MSVSFAKNRKQKKRDYLKYCRNAVKINPRSKRWADLKTLDPAFYNREHLIETKVSNVFGKHYFETILWIGLVLLAGLLTLVYTR